MIACRIALTATAMLLALTGCSSGSDAPTPPATTSAATTETPVSPTAPTGGYVALGDSFTAGPGIDPQQADAGFCGRSRRNWPAVLAAAVRLELSDVSCSGATTTDLASTVASGAIDGGPRLVTVSSGGNDGGLFSSLISGCATGGTACAAYVADQVPGILAQTSDDVEALLETVRSGAPDAVVVLVGYPRILPETGGCDAVGITDSASVLTAETALDTTLADAAERAGVPYVSLREASAGHDACAGSQAWVNGRSGSSGDGIVFHPTARGMAAIADVVARTAGVADLG